MNKQQLAAYQAGWKTALATKNKNEGGNGVPNWLITEDKEIKEKLEEVMDQVDSIRRFIAEQEEKEYNGESNWLGKSASDYANISAFITSALNKLKE